MKKSIQLVVLSTLIVLFSCKKTEPVSDYSKPEIQLNKYSLEADTLIEALGTVERNETLGEIFESYGINYQTVLNLVHASKDSFDLRKIKSGNDFALYFTDDSLREIKHFVYEIDPVNYIVYNFQDSLTIRKSKKETIIREREVAGIINSSLWGTMMQINVNPVLAIELSEVFAWQINFYGIQQGDRFKVIFKEAYVDSQFVGINEITCAEFIHKNEPYNAIRYIQDGHVEYFDTSGHSLQKQFLKAPLKFSRISSGYNPNRLHPVLKRARPHLGVDFAAPRGTPVRAIGDGDVIFRGRMHEPGNFIKIKHNGTYSSGYMHLSKFEKNIVVGKRVRQGDIIGYVGSTGLSTGPHLDLRFWKNGQLVNYLTQKFPPTHPVKEENKNDFNNVVKSILINLEKIPYPKNTD
ncbi:MAG: peptidoglycan DD-metalloendopeptidase family protein [Bacteroidetes bacterium]|nr:peptidoglycan DD-metalloendopeptidase family protein [Bacteroidota bacterium]